MYASKRDLLEYAKKMNYDIDNFEKYLLYQLVRKSAGVQSIEEYIISNPDGDIEDENFRKYYCLLNGFTGYDSIPDYCNFQIYCNKRQINYQKGQSYQIK